MKHIREIPTLIIMVGSIILSACTTTTITPEITERPSQRVDTIAVGNLEAADTLWEDKIPYFRRALVERLRESKAFRQILDPAPEPLPEGTVRLSGHVTEIDKGSQALRLLIGFGAGRARAAGTFEIRDQDGTLLARFESRKAYSGGIGIGGIDLLDMDELAQRLGEETADTVIRWSQGRPLQPPQSEER